MSTASRTASDEHGIVTRVSSDWIAYLWCEALQRSFSFGPDVIGGYRGETFDELGIGIGRSVSFQWDVTSGAVTAVLARAAATAGHEMDVDSPIGRRTRCNPRDSLRSAPDDEQFQLLTGTAPAGVRRVNRALPLKTRHFGKLVETAPLRYGDLMLSRHARSEDFFARIADLQARGGHHDLDARWTHAAMYIGDIRDEPYVVEADFDGLLSGGSVRMTSLDQYCQGDNVLRFRRPNGLGDERDAFRLCVGAMSRLKERYDIKKAAELWFKVMIRRRGFYESDGAHDAPLRQVTEAAVICSTLYADAYNRVTRRTLGDYNGVCVPASLSLSNEFEDIEVAWVGIA